MTERMGESIYYLNALNKIAFNSIKMTIGTREDPTPYFKLKSVTGELISLTSAINYVLLVDPLPLKQITNTLPFVEYLSNNILELKNINTAFIDMQTFFESYEEFKKTMLFGKELLYILIALQAAYNLKNLESIQEETQKLVNLFENGKQIIYDI
jgi:hypothetical protein